MTYNGWKNRETWLIGVWELTDYLAESIPARVDNTQEAAELLEAAFGEWFYATYPQAQEPGLLADMLAISAIDWREIAEHILSDRKDEAEELEGEDAA
jgi:hypothetical protein